MYSVAKNPSKIVAKTRGYSQNYDNFESIKTIGRRKWVINGSELINMPRPVFQTIKKSIAYDKLMEKEIISPQHEEIIKYINDSWNVIVADNPYDLKPDVNDNTSVVMTPPITSTIQLQYSQHSVASLYCVEPPNPVLTDFKPFDLESWWGRRLFNNITKSP
ncbi:uncharacterized protein LOC119673456 isoform X2 [Teleopsis dalmanni]|uniref:uncharacterized protein LOC119673456 isoform X2 n=1 Tax=Teleopsis dalmanni TaxID=139649 RepID=UPI0018CE31BF|nr:uncharacterized protein LOC119673456 isoform X2 [Teleopsis dalmanni]